MAKTRVHIIAGGSEGEEQSIPPAALSTVQRVVIAAAAAAATIVVAWHGHKNQKSIKIHLIILQRVLFCLLFAFAFAPRRICLKCSFQCRQVSAKTWQQQDQDLTVAEAQEIGNVKAKKEKKMREDNNRNSSREQEQDEPRLCLKVN